MRVVLTIISFVLLGVGSGCSSEILATDFDQSCSADTDCVSVLVGDMCSCACTTGAINKRDLPAYTEERGDISCSIDCGPCPELETPVCKSGACSVE